MQRFDCLDPAIDLKGHFFLEASAGTGKTFAIEHVVARLLENGDATLDQILVVTFTRASTRDLKGRIRATLERFGLRRALYEIDKAPIFTIHGFCQRMLTEFGFEAGIHLGEMDEGTSRIGKHILDYMRTSLDPERWSPNQIALLLKGGVSKLVKEVAGLIEKNDPPEYQSYSSNVKRLYIAMQPFVGQPIVDEFFRVANEYKGICKRNGEPHEKFVEQIKAIASGASLDDFLNFSVLESLAPEKRKSRAKESSHLLDSIREAVLPIVNESRDVVKRLAYEAKGVVKRALEVEEVITPDDLLKKMEEATHIPLFAQRVRGKYRAVIIDEFQDTDPMQWKIFSRLFSNVETLFLVGDPKQSIYSFRGADLYTYLQASEEVKHHRLLDTNYRSEPALVDALNTLFLSCGEWLTLPKKGKALKYTPVQSKPDGANTDFGDGKTPIHFWKSEDIMPLIVSEIEWLVQKKGFSYSDMAILVKDRYQGERVRSYLQKRGIPLVAKASEPLKNSEAFTLMRNLLIASHNPFDRSAALQVSSDIEQFHIYNELGSLSKILGEFDAFHLGTLEGYGDFVQLSELLLEYENRCRATLPQLVAFLDSMGEEEIFLRRPIGDDDAVNVMTIHMSKGLEFEIVFPIGLSVKSPVGDEEKEAEKMRQLYVALTRAKRRVYVPLPTNKTASPMELLLEKLPISLEKLGFTISDEMHYENYEREKKRLSLSPPPPLDFTFPSRHLLSFSSLAKKHIVHSDQPPSLPAGSETGTVLHGLLEGAIAGKNVDELIKRSSLAEHTDEVRRIIDAALTTSLGAWSLQQVDTMETEVEFLYPSGDDMIKGFIDLIFIKDGKYYILDWKSNDLGGDYSEKRVEQAMHDGDYFLQAKLYARALKRSLSPRPFDEVFGGVYYLFLRGLPEGKGIHYHRPDV